METCAACGEPFGCGNVEGKTSCWCSGLPAVMPVTGKGCLCPRCLKAEIASRVGDCFACSHSKTLKTKSGSAMFLCGRAEDEPSYARYPALPLLGGPGRSPL
ncbi:MAG: cysteine-rich CWC family protein [Elusimicrobia bacterium]|nr:cysteine-rich CWC family protein [Elusimicrobiota bacterium]